MLIQIFVTPDFDKNENLEYFRSKTLQKENQNLEYSRFLEILEIWITPDLKFCKGKLKSGVLQILKKSKSGYFFKIWITPDLKFC